MKAICVLAFMFLLYSCGSGSSTDSGSITQVATANSYIFSTKFQGVDRVLTAINEPGTDLPVIKLSTADGSDRQKWFITNDVNGSFNITNLSLGREYSIDVINNEAKDRIHFSASQNVSGQHWNITPIGNGYCHLTNNFTGIEVALDIRNDNEKDTPVLSSIGDFTGQQWRIELSDGTSQFSQCNDDAVVANTVRPLYAGTAQIDPNIVISTDPSSFQSLNFKGRGLREMHDRRVGWVTLSVYLFDASYDDGLNIEIQVNPEFSESEARIEAERYAPMFGQLPTLLRKNVKTSWIHKGDYSFGGGNNNIQIHTGRAAKHRIEGIVEEILIHEASHASLDMDIAQNQEWIDAQQSDPTFMSTYAQNNPNREDVAESFLSYIALRYRRDRISDEYAENIELSIPNRIKYFDTVVRDMYPLE